MAPAEVVDSQVMTRPACTKNAVSRLDAPSNRTLLATGTQAHQALS